MSLVDHAGPPAPPRIRRRSRGRVAAVGALVVGLLSSALPGVAAAQTVSPDQAPLFAPARIDQGCEGGCTGPTLSEPNSSRKIAVAPDGTIHATFRANEGIFVARSTDRGESFAAPARVTATVAQPAIAASSSGVAFVAWVETGTAYLSRNDGTDGTWSAPVTMATGLSTTTVQLAVDGDHVYAVDRSGQTLMRSDDAGATFTTTTVAERSWVYADVHVDPLTHDVYVLVDDPSVSYYRSTDRGASFGPAVAVPVSVFHSVGALTSSPDGAVAYVAGQGTNLERIDLADGTVEHRTVATTDGSTRSLGADAFGNVVSGAVSDGQLRFQVSTDLGATFSDPVTLGAGARANASINTTNGDVLFLHETGGEVRLAVYGDLLGGYDVIVDRSAVSFSAVGQARTVTVTNTSGEPRSVVQIAVGDGEPFDVTDTCGGSLAAGASCTITLTPTARASGVLTVHIGAVRRDLPLTFSAVEVVELAEPTFGLVTSTPDGFTVALTDTDEAATYEASVDVGTVAIVDGVITVTGLQPGAAATVTVTATKDGATPASATVTGHATDAPAVTPSPTRPVPDTGGVTLPAPRSGTASATVGGSEIGVDASPTSGGYRVRAGGLELDLTVVGTPLAASTRAGAPYLVASSSDLRVQATGLQPGSTARVWLFSTPQLLGTVPVDGEGRVSVADLPLPDSVTACSHTLQLAGVTATGEVAAVNLGVTVVPEPFPFGDVAIDQVHAAGIGCAEDHGIVRGFRDGSFLPTDGLTRGQFASMLARSLDLDAATTSRFGDVAGTTHEGAIAALEAAGLVRGFEDGTFRPRQVVTRGQVASLLAAADGLDPVAQGPFSDVAASPHGGAINALVGTRVVEGYPDGTFRPGRPVERAQAASLFVRYLGL